MYSNSSEINVSGVISDNSYIFDVINSILSNREIYSVADLMIDMRLWYVIDGKEYMMAVFDGETSIYEVFPDKEPVYIDNPKEVYPCIYNFKERLDLSKIDLEVLSKDNIIIVTNRTEIYGTVKEQQGFIKKITDYFDKADKHIQVIVLTNSPFVMSDLLLDNCCYIDDNWNIQKKDNETFAANLFELLCENLGMSYSYGEIGQKLIRSIVEKKRSGRRVNDEVLKYIGDKFLKTSIKNIKKIN